MLGWDRVGVVAAQLNRCVENWSRQYEGSEAYNEGSAWIFPNLAFVTAACWLHNIFNHKSSTVGKHLKSSNAGKHLKSSTVGKHLKSSNAGKQLQV